MRAGRAGVSVLVGIILGIVALLAVTALWGDVIEDLDEDLDGLQKCEGLIETLAGGDGKCFPYEGCSQVEGEDRTTPRWYGPYWQRLGEGWGCAEGTYCCVEVGVLDDTIGDVDQTLSEHFCKEEEEPGSVRVVKDLGKLCLPSEHPEAAVPVDAPFDIRYYPHEGEEGRFCSLHFTIQGLRTGARQFVCDKPISIIMGTDLRSIYSQLPEGTRDPATLNGMTELPIEIFDGSEKITDTIVIDPGLDICSLSSDEPCAGEVLDSSIGVKKYSIETGKNTVYTTTCHHVGDSVCRRNVNDDEFIRGEGVCHTVVDDKGNELEDSPCLGLSPILPCWTKNWWFSQNTHVCTQIEPTVCRDDNLGNQGRSDLDNYALTAGMGIELMTQAQFTDFDKYIPDEAIGQVLSDTITQIFYESRERDLYPHCSKIPRPGD